MEHQSASVRNLSEIEAIDRARIVRVTDYDISLDLTDAAGHPGAGTFRSITRVSFECADPGASTTIDLAAARLRSVRLDGVDVDTSAWSPERGLVLAGLAAVNTLVVDADFAYSSSGQGLHRSVDPVDGEVYLYSQFEIADAQRVFACFDQPDLKSVFTWHVTAPARWRIISNAPIDRIVVDEATGAKVVHFEPSIRMSSYVTALCAGPFHEVRTEHDGIDLGLFIRQSSRQHLDTDELFLLTRQGFDFFHREFGVRYPLPKYNQIFVTDYNAAAMENFGCVTISEDLFIFPSQVTDFELEKRANHMLHELAHMWFGDLVTMRWWGDIWLKEAFAEWASHWCNAENTRFTDAWTTFLAIRKSWGYAKDQLSSTHPVYADALDVASAEANFDGITYAKGASVIKQIVAYVGLDAFRAGLRDYLTTHARANATFDDLLTALEAAAGVELRDFAAQWLETSQVNTLRPIVSVTPDGLYDSVAIEQEAPPEHPTLRTHRIALGLYDLRGDRLVRRERVEVVVQGRQTEIPELSGVREPDLLLVNDDDLTYAKIRLDARSLSTVMGNLSGLESSLARALCWAAVWDMTRDAELPARDYVRLVVTALPRETDINLITSALRQVQTAIDLYADPTWAPVGRQSLTDTARAAVTAARPGSGTQLAWARAFVAAARQPEELDLLRRWLGGDGVPAGLAIDAELRWSIVATLVAEGAAGSEEIATEVDRDRSASGERAAATARALLPTPEAKALAWHDLTAETLSNRLRAILAGFYHPSQLALTRPYLPGYFEAVGRVWATHDNQVAHTFAVHGYPAGYVDQAVVDATDAWLADGSRPVPLRRLVTDGRDGQVRALAARARDAAAR